MRLKLEKVLCPLLWLGVFHAAPIFALPENPVSNGTVTPSSDASARDTALPDVIDGAGAIDGQGAGMVVNSFNGKEFKDLLPPEIYPLIRSNLVELNVARALHYSFVRPPGGESVEGKASITLNSDGTLVGDIPFSQSVLFDEVRSRSSESEDSSKLALKLLWNVNSQLWSGKLYEADFVVHWIREGKLLRQIGGLWQRIYPKAVNQDDKTIQLFRERISITAPGYLKGFSWLTFRFFGREEDMFWERSPVLQKTRQLAGSNRTDPMLNTAISPEDLLAWSGKPDLVDIKSFRAMKLLALFPGLESDSLVQDQHCLVFQENVSTGDRQSRWNFQSRRFPVAFGWVPSTAAAVPRNLWRIELVSHDPYSLYGRQIIYIDQEFGLPTYKFVYNRAGFLWKIVIALFSKGATPNGAHQTFVPRSLIVHDLISKEEFVLEFSRFKQCQQYTEQLSLAQFDPQKL